MSLSEKTNEDIIQLLKKYDIKHGPIVGSTRGLYEKKLRDAMAKGSSPQKASPDKTFYREEEEEVTYVHYRSPVQSTGYGDVSRRNIIHDEEDYDEEHHTDSEPEIQSSRSAYHSAAQSQEPIPTVAGGMSLGLRLLLLAVVAVCLYILYCNM